MKNLIVIVALTGLILAVIASGTAFTTTYSGTFASILRNQASSPDYTATI